MMRKINVYVNKEYAYSTLTPRTPKQVIQDARATKHIEIASIPPRYITIYDYDKVNARYAD